MFPYPCCLNKENVFFYGFAFEMVTNEGKTKKSGGLNPGCLAPGEHRVSSLHLYSSLKAGGGLYIFKLY